ncbi:MAG: bifunctional 5,10-methylenetetrahydrofolate dehydrogenase/5,10-methenyltetrahydrofolate cyclohydrolase, partial [Patescibacteria group bacterium]
MIVDGKAIAESIYAETRALVLACPHPPVLAAITCNPNFETRKYLELKKTKAARVGITLRVIELPETATTDEAVSCIKAVVHQVDGVVVQLPFPAHVDRETILAAVPVEKDPDGFSYGKSEKACLPPVVGAMAEIARTHGITFENKNVVVLGEGRLVGKPVAFYLRQVGAKVTVLTEADTSPHFVLKAAEVIISGIGAPHFVTKDMVKEGIVVFDAGTSEDGGLV